MDSNIHHLATSIITRIDDPLAQSMVLDAIIYAAVPFMIGANEQILLIKRLCTKTSNWNVELASYGVDVSAEFHLGGEGMSSWIEVHASYHTSATTVKYRMPSIHTRQLAAYNWGTGKLNQPEPLDDYIRKHLGIESAAHEDMAVVELARVLAVYIEEQHQITARKFDGDWLPLCGELDDQQILPHLKWMLETIAGPVGKGMSVTKKHRWLGFVQAELIRLGWITVQEFRDVTRKWFNGY